MPVVANYDGSWKHPLCSLQLTLGPARHREPCHRDTGQHLVPLVDTQPKSRTGHVFLCYKQAWICVLLTSTVVTRPLVHNDTAHSPAPSSPSFSLWVQIPSEQVTKITGHCVALPRSSGPPPHIKSGFLRVWFHPAPFQIFYLDLRPSFSLLSALWIISPSIAFRSFQENTDVSYVPREGRQGNGERSSLHW